MRDVDEGTEPENGDTVEPVVTADVLRATPEVILHTLGMPIDITEPVQAEISSLSLYVGRDQSGRETYQLSINLSTDGTAGELTDELDVNPLLPLRGIDIPLPTFDYFYDWSDPRTWIEQLDSGATGSVTIESRRQSQRAGTGVAPGPATDPLRVFGADRDLPMGITSSLLVWNADRADQIEARVSFTAFPERRTEVIEWIRLHAEPGTYRSTFGLSTRDERVDGQIEAVLAGEPPVAVTWGAGSYRDSMTATFSYLIDEYGRALPTPDLAVAPERKVLIEWGDSWSVDDDGAGDPGWSAPDFDDSTWRSANGPFVRGERVPDADSLRSPESGQQVWFRRDFEVDDPDAIAGLDVSYQADDALVIFLNGVELHRWNVPNGPVEPSTFAAQRVSGADETLVRTVTDLPADWLVQGRNVIAAVVLQATPDSDDTRFDLHMEGQ